MSRICYINIVREFAGIKQKGERMIPISIYTLSRIDNWKMVQKMERQMSKRKHPLNVKGWEVEGLRRLSNHLYNEMPEFSNMRFFYSFMIPRIGKEFDLLRISKDYVINIELKSGNVLKEAIKKQLLQNRDYLNSLGRSVRSYTYVSGEDKLYRLTKGDNLVEAEWSKLCSHLKDMEDCYEEDLEELFNESKFLISPLTDSDRFLNGEYFLTYQQRDIRNHILQNIQKNNVRIQSFAGLPGTGKTLLLYDIAMKLSLKLRVCVLHFGFFPEELSHLNARLKRIDFYSCRNMDCLPDMEGYSYILVDEGHQMGNEILDEILAYSEETGIPVVFAYDQEEAISLDENDAVLYGRLKAIPELVEYQLTNRIRMNKELSTFIHSLMCPAKYHHRREYPSVSVAFANDEKERDIILADFIKEGYVYIEDATDTTCKEFDQVVMVVDDSFYYDETGALRSKETGERRFGVRNLFHGLNRAKNQIGIVVLGSEAMLQEILEILQ